MFHCIPFLAAAAAGAIITYIATDRQTRDRIRTGTDKVVDGLKDGLERTTRAAKVLARPASHRDRQEDAGLEAQPSTH
jgi:hypothetical protein